MQIIGTRGQAVPSPSYDFSGSITTGGTAQLLLPQQTQRAYLLIENISDTNMFIEVGPPTATCTISSGAVNAVSIVNAGFNYTIAPIVTFVGGGAYPGYSGVSGGLTYPNPSGFATTNVSNTNPPTLNRQAEGHCVMTGSAGNLSISSISIDDAGAGYVS